MKTKFSVYLLTAIAAVALLTASCSKEDDDLQSPGNSVSGKTQVGKIIDYGPISGNVRRMTLTLSNQGNVYDENSGILIGKINEIALDIYVDEDGQIPTGSYVFKGPETREINTFSNGSVSLQYVGQNVGSTKFSLTDGTMGVVNNSGLYNLNLTVTLDSGHSINISTSGSLSYKDTY